MIVWDFNHCVSIFKQEISLLQRILMVQNSVQQSVMAREWTDFDWKMAEINQFSEEFAGLDSERAELFAVLKEKFSVPDQAVSEKSSHGTAPDKNEPSFYSLASKLPQDEQHELFGLYRELKLSVLKLKAQNETFTGYINEIKSITAAWMEAIFPVQGGKLYTRKGRQAAAELHSMVLNHRV